MLNKTIDNCELFSNPTYEPIIQFFYAILTKTGTFPKKCPITKVKYIKLLDNNFVQETIFVQRLYYIKDVVIDTDSFPPTLPSTACIGDVNLMSKKGKDFQIVGGFKIQARIKSN